MESTNLAAYYFHQGTNYTAYDYMGCNLRKDGNKFVYTFRTWAPSAERVEVVGDFTGWNNPKPLRRITDKGIWECEYISTEPIENSAYKFLITRNGRSVFKGDPYARYSKGGADGASIVFTSKYKWGDSLWMKARKKKTSQNPKGYLSTPINIYEVHFGSFMRHEDDSYYTYREMADVLVPYLKYMGYTHVEFLPLAEHPFDGSWGYQVCGFYAPTSRFGTPDDFRYLIDQMHKNGIGVIMDWVPAHFPKDEWGLYEFDGGPLYEYQGQDRKESRTWGTRFFDLGREEVQSFLVSNAMYFFREFHIDGLRVDAVASMIYLDYDKDPGEWIPNKYGNRDNLEAVAFLQKLNSVIFSEYHDVLMIAEESGSHGGITKPVHSNGLGFNLKWNMGWANDFYDYVLTDPLFRKYKHSALTFPLMYSFDENYVLPISHDEVVHGKLSFINKMYGSYEDKFRQMRASLLLQMTYPGKKLLFMGTEYAQFREWDFESSLEWFMLDYPLHRAMREYTAALNRFYLKEKSLWERDFDPYGFQWLYADELEKNSVIYRRYDTKGDSLIIAINFSGSEQRFKLWNLSKKYLCSVFETEGPGSVTRKTQIKNKSCEIVLPPFSGAVFKEKNADNIINI